MNKPVIEEKYKFTWDTRVIPIVTEHEEYKIQLAWNTSISTDAGEPDTLK